VFNFSVLLLVKGFSVLSCSGKRFAITVVKIIRAAPDQVKVLARMLIKQDEFARYSKSCHLNHGTKTLKSWDKSIEIMGQKHGDDGTNPLKRRDKMALVKEKTCKFSFDNLQVFIYQPVGFHL